MGELIVVPIEDNKGYIKGYKTIKELIRCKDCKYWASADRYCEILDTWFFATGFCSLGERKAEE